MRISRIEINNFRSIRHAVVELGDTTVLVGPNNAGKTAILDALRISLKRRYDLRGTGFSEYDIHMTSESDGPKTSSGVSIELTAEEGKSGEWPDTITEDLGNIIQLDLTTGRRSITLRTRFWWESDSETFQRSWEFLDANQETLVGSSGRRTSQVRFWLYLPIFYLGALRDAADEFSSRSSQFWAKLLKDLNISPALEAQTLQVLDQLNSQLLKDDPRLEQIAKTLSSATTVASRDGVGGLDLRMVPLKTWDLLSRAEIILRNEPLQPWLPLTKQGQGIQSLSVIFLFQAFVDHMLRELYEPDSEPVLALEEPETHLHPQAVRTLWSHVNGLPGQKILSTHSPYFVQNVPFRDLRLVRLTENGTEVGSLPSCFSARIPHLEGLDSAIDKYSDQLTYNPASEVLTVFGKLEKNTYANLLLCCAKDERRAEVEPILIDLNIRSSHYVTDDELQALETYARRVRGEIFFAQS